jgi:hypothetical protein
MSFNTLKPLVQAYINAVQDVIREVIDVTSDVIDDAVILKQVEAALKEKGIYEPENLTIADISSLLYLDVSLKNIDGADLPNHIDIYLVLYKKIKDIISNHLTIGRSDNGLDPFTNEEIDKFILNHSGDIKKTINNMIEAYEEDDELEELLDPLPDWIQEYIDFLD